MMFIFFGFLIGIEFQETPERNQAWINGQNEILTREFIERKSSISDLKTIEIKGISEISSGTFMNFVNLQHVSIGSGCTKISDFVFKNCYNLREAIIPEGVLYLGANCFEGNENLRTVYIPSSLTMRFHQLIFSACNSLKNITVAPNNPLYKSSEDNQLLIYNGSIVVLGSGNTTVSIPDYITHIDSYSFFHRSYLSKVEFVDNGSLRRISTNAFYSTNIKSLRLPRGIKYVETYAFIGSPIETIFVPNTVIEISNLLDMSLESVDLENGSTIFARGENGTILNIDGTKILFVPKGIQEIYIGSNIREVPYNALISCQNLSVITVDPNNDYLKSEDGILYSSSFELMVCPKNKTTIAVSESCTKIHNSVFHRSKITSIIFKGNMVSYIGNSFNSAKELKSIEIPEGVLDIENWCFLGSGLESCSLPSSLNNIQNNLFNGCPLKSIDLSKCVKITMIDQSAFINNVQLESVIWPTKLRILSEKSFSGCTNLESVVFPSEISIIEQSAFANCRRLRSIEFSGSTIATIKNSAFSNCNITYLKIPDSLTELSQESFAGNAFLETVEISESSQMKSIQTSVFKDCGLIQRIFIGRLVDSVSEGAFAGMSGLTNIEVSKDNEKYISDRGVLHSIDMRTLVAFPGGISKFVISNLVSSIGGRAFFGCFNLLNIGFDQGSVLTEIGSYTFYKCSNLTSVLVPGSVSTLSGSAFAGCSRLDSITFDSQESTGASALKSFESSCFEGCDLLTKIKFNGRCELEAIGDKAFSGCSKLTEFPFGLWTKTIGSQSFAGCRKLEIGVNDLLRVVSIGDNAFEGCTMIRNLRLGSNLTYIGDLSFNGCVYLKNIYYCGTTIFTKDAFGGLKPTILVVPGYPEKETFCRVQVSGWLDAQCNPPTSGFTFSEDADKNLLIFINSSILKDES